MKPQVTLLGRVLIFLEAQALGRPTPNFAVHLAEELLPAARTLGLRSLEVGLLPNPSCEHTLVWIPKWAQ